MKKTFFLSFFTLLQITSINTMQELPTLQPAQGAVPSSPEQEVPILPGFLSLDNHIVPQFFGYQIVLPRNISLTIYRAFTALNGKGLITPVIERKIDRMLSKADKLIYHGQKTNQLRLFRKGNKENIAIRETLAIQLLQLNICGVDDEGRLDPRLTVLADFFIENSNAHCMTPFIEDEEDELQTVPEQRQPLSRRLLYN